MLLATVPPKARQFWTAASNFLTTNHAEWVTIEKGTEQLEAWRKYFQWKGWEPFALKALDRGKCETIVMPTEFPEWFDPAFARKRLLVVTE